MSSERRVVTFHYTLRDPEGRLIDTSAGNEPIAYLEGAGMIIDGLDEALREVAPGTKTKVVVPAAKGYGERDPAQVRKVPRSALPVEGEIKVGDQFQTGPDRADPVVTVAGVEEDGVVLDANHPLAGVELAFEVELVAARPATAQELEHGHVHGPDSDCA
ncbi:FKBP-type peptidyl-prolyl cis-trans isomerase [Synoicihabitans lomoniglobus]|uniref:Peptidyl-prolyl cis-trans isomerase n=1 Tax=Synoicihabitans lomoniglobus TaxID=2909285 RepID=A0AAE9ZVN4_9BACT|nr:peptidylprolyl isomerase [Opitutaceae bacterium LMO-M01]WED65011.1 peptidylprolyl isomerase [Opitutaceae bacterium LMO-M01]